MTRVKRPGKRIATVGERRKDDFIGVKMTEEHKRELKKRANLLGLSQSEYVVWKTLGLMPEDYNREVPGNDPQES